MKKITLFVLIIAAAIMFAACGGENNTAATAPGTDAPKPAPGPPTKEALLTLEKNAFEAWKKKDGKYFDENLDDNFVMFANQKRMSKWDTSKMITDNPCTINSYSIADDRMTPAGNDAAVMTFTVTQDVVCDGKKAPPTYTATTVYRRSGDKWKIAYHNEAAPIVKSAPAKPAAPEADKAEESAKAAANKPGDKGLTGVMGLHKGGWDAWMARDAKRLSDWATDDVVFVEPGGKVYAGKADAVKARTEPKCDIKSVAVGEGTEVDLSADAKLLLSKGTPVGTCEGEKLGPLWGMAVYVKQGEAWKVAYLLEWPA